MNAKVRIKCVETGEIFDSIKSAANKLSINEKSITMCVNKKQKTAGGYRFIRLKGKNKSKNDKPKQSAKSKNVNTTESIVNIEETQHKGKENVDVTELKSVINLMVTDFMKYRSLMSKLKNEHFVLRDRYEKLKEEKPDDIYKNIVDMMLNDFTSYRERVFQHFDKKDNKIEELELENLTLTERIQIIIKSPEYKSFAERESREGCERAQKEKEAWNIVDNPNDEFSMFTSAPRRRTITDYEDERLA